MAWPLAPREMWARGNHLSDAESALPGVGGSPTHQSAELAPVPSRQGGHSPIEAGASVSADQLLQATQAKGQPPAPLTLGQVGPTSISPLSSPCPQALSASGIKSRPHSHSRPSGPTPPASSPASSPSAQVAPESALLPNVQHTCRPLGICTCCFLSVQMPFHSTFPCRTAVPSPAPRFLHSDSTRGE